MILAGTLVARICLLHAASAVMARSICKSMLFPGFTGAFFNLSNFFL